MLKPIAESLNARILSVAQARATADPGHSAGASDDQKPQRFHAAGQVRVGPFARPRFRLGSGVELKAPDQVVGEHVELLPGAVRAVVIP